MGVNGATEQQGVIAAWQRELDDPATTDERRRQIVNEWTAARVADAANRGTECLKAAGERDAAWNIERAEVLSCYRIASNELLRMKDAMKRLPGADWYDVAALVDEGDRLLMQNAETAYRRTLYPHEHLMRENFIDVLEGSSEDAERIVSSGFLWALGTASGFGLVQAGAVGIRTVLGGVCSSAALSAAAIGTLFATGLLSIAKGISHLYIQATLPEMETLPVAAGPGA